MENEIKGNTGLPNVDSARPMSSLYILSIMPHGRLLFKLVLGISRQIVRWVRNLLKAVLKGEVSSWEELTREFLVLSVGMDLIINISINNSWQGQRRYLESKGIRSRILGYLYRKNEWLCELKYKMRLNLVVQNPRPCPTSTISWEVISWKWLRWERTWDTSWS